MKFESGLQAAYTDTITKQVGPGEYTKDSDYPTVGASDGIWLASSYGSDSNSGLTPLLAKATQAGAEGARTAGRPYIYINDSDTYQIAATLDFSAADAKGIVAAVEGILGAVNAAPVLEFTDTTDEWITGNTADVHVAGLTMRATGVMDPGSMVDLTSCDDAMFCYNALEADITDGDSPVNSVPVTLTTNNRLICVGNVLSFGISPALLVYNGGTNRVERNIVFRQAGPATGTNPLTRSALAPEAYSSRTVNFSAAAGTATITSGSMTVNAYQGQYLYTQGTGDAFLISSNTTTIFYLEDVFGIGFPSTSGTNVRVIDEAYDTGITLSGATSTGTCANNLVIGESPLDGGIAMLAGGADWTIINNSTLNARVNVGIILDGDGTGTGDPVLQNNYAAIASAIYEVCTRNSVVQPLPGTMTLSNTGAVIAPDPLLLNAALLGQAPDLTAFTSDGWLEYANAARLKRIGAKYYSSDSTVILINSPLVDAGEGVFGDDLSPWVEAVTGPTYAAGSVLEIEWPPHDMAITFEAVNPTEKANIRGDIKTFVDSWRKVFTFNFSDYANNENAWKLQTLKECLTAIQMYFIDVGTSIFTASDTLTLSGSGDSRTATPEGLTIQLIPDHWEGLQILIDGEYYYISESTASTFTLLDKRGVGFPANGSGIEFAVDSILVRAATESLNIVAPYFLNFQQGNSWMEKAFPDTLAHEYTPFSAMFKEIEDIDD